MSQAQLSPLCASFDCPQVPAYRVIAKPETLPKGEQARGFMACKEHGEYFRENARLEKL